MDSVWGNGILLFTYLPTHVYYYFGLRLPYLSRLIIHDIPGP